MRVPAAILAACLVACAASLGPKLELDWNHDPKVSFAELTSFGWLPGQPPVHTGDPRVDDALLEKRVREAVTNELEAKGYAWKLAGTPSFWVAYDVSLSGRLDVTAVSRAYGFDPTWGGFHPGTGGRGPLGKSQDVQEADQGTLILDVIDPAAKKLIWRGAAGTRVAPERDSERQKIERINEIVRELLARFPPHNR